jgi:hypothetical protein
MNAHAPAAPEIRAPSLQRSAGFYALQWSRIYVALRGLMPSAPAGMVLRSAAQITDRIPSWVRRYIDQCHPGFAATRHLIDKVIEVLPPVYGDAQAIAAPAEDTQAMVEGFLDQVAEALRGPPPAAALAEAQEIQAHNPQTAIRAAGLRFVANVSRALVDNAIGKPSQRPNIVLQASAQLYDQAKAGHASLQQSAEQGDILTSLHATMLVLQALFLGALAVESPEDLSTTALEALWTRTQCDYNHAAGAAAVACARRP